jgi:hypothetical protein
VNRGIPEQDWKLMQRLKPVLLDRLCQRILREVACIAGEDAATYHKRYPDVFKLIDRRDEDVGAAFNDWRRSTAFERLAAIRKLGLFDQQEFEQLTEDTQALLRMLVPQPDD